MELQGVVPRGEESLSPAVILRFPQRALLTGEQQPLICLTVALGELGEMLSLSVFFIMASSSPEPCYRLGDIPPRVLAGYTSSSFVRWLGTEWEGLLEVWGGAPVIFGACTMLDMHPDGAVRPTAGPSLARDCCRKFWGSSEALWVNMSLRVEVLKFCWKVCGDSFEVLWQSPCLRGLSQWLPSCFISART